eukprot:GEMP01024469.1.p1 GENE.GEMP01024469.1~~GEMP01024469.1.p1  ORF type:complete len:379 (+),score=77.61 GEMP01024469.1:80-1216(+)
MAPKRKRCSEGSLNQNAEERSAGDSASSVQAVPKKKIRKSVISAVSRKSLRGVAENLVEKIEFIESIFETVEHLPTRRLLMMMCVPALSTANRGPFHERSVGILVRGLAQLSELQVLEIASRADAFDSLNAKRDDSSNEVEMKKKNIERQEKEITDRGQDIHRLASELQAAVGTHGLAWREATNCRQLKEANEADILYYESIQTEHLKPLCFTKTEDTSIHVKKVLPALKRMFSDESLIVAADNALHKNSEQRTGFDVLSAHQVVRNFSECIAKAKEHARLFSEREKRANDALEAASEKVADLEKRLENARKTAEEATAALGNMYADLHAEETRYWGYQSECSEEMEQLEMVKSRRASAQKAMDLIKELSPQPLCCGA